MASFYFFEGKNKAARKLEKYLNELAETPGSGVKRIDVTPKELEDKIMKEYLEMYDDIRMYKHTSPDDLTLKPVSRFKKYLKNNKKPG